MITSVIFIGGGSNQLPFLKALWSLNIKILLIDVNTDCPGKKYASVFVNKSNVDTSGIAKCLAQIATDYSKTFILNGCSGNPILTTAIIANELKIPSTYSIPVASLLIDKWQYKIRVKNLGLPTPSGSEITEKGKMHLYNSNRWVLKPKVGSVSKKNLKLLKTTSSRFSQEFRPNFANYYAEEYIEGTDIIFVSAVDGHNFLPISFIDEMNQVLPHGEIKSAKYRFPSKYVNAFLRSKIIGFTKTLTKNIDHGRCILNLSFRVSGKNLYFIESHIELGGDFILQNLLNFAFGQTFLQKIMLFLVANPSHRLSELTTNKVFTLALDKGEYKTADGRKYQITQHKH